MVLLEGSWQLLQLILEILIYIAIIIFLITEKGSRRLIFLIILVGYFMITFYFNDPFLSAALITMWFLFSGITFFVSRELLIAFAIIMLILGYSNPLFYFIAVLFYIINVTNFIFAGLKRVRLGG